MRNPTRVPGKLTEQEEEASPERIHKLGIKQTREAFRKRTYEYWNPFHYPNARVELGRPGTNAEMGGGIELDIPPCGAITVEASDGEEIIEVEVIGNTCVPPGYIFLFGEPVEWKYPRTGVKMKATDLWGAHVHWLLWSRGMRGGNRGMGQSTAFFSIPECKKITVMGGGQTDTDKVDPVPDHHPYVEGIRITVKESI